MQFLLFVLLAFLLVRWLRRRHQSSV